MIRIKGYFTALALATLTTAAVAQTADTVSTLTVTGYVDVYCAYYTDSISTGNIQQFGFISPRSDNPSLNIAQLAIDYDADRVRAAATIHIGDIPTAVWAPAPYKRIQEAWAGFRIIRNIWLDAGFFRTHMGAEYLLPRDNIASSNTIGSYYEPFFESGLKLSAKYSKLEIGIFLLNGYNIFIDNNKKKSTGISIIYTASDNFNMGITTYRGDDTPDGIAPAHDRSMANFFLNYQRGKNKLQFGADYCTQSNSDLKTGTSNGNMFCALLTVRRQLGSKLGVYVRGEVFRDHDGIMAGLIKNTAGNMTGLNMWGYTGGFEYKPTKDSYIRLEGRTLYTDKGQLVFHDSNTPVNYRSEIMLNAGVSFELLRKITTR